MPPATKSSSTIGWMGIKRGHRARPFEWLVEKGIWLVSMSAIVLVGLIFIFIGRESLPIFLGTEDSSHSFKVIKPEAAVSTSPEELAAYLEMTPKEIAELDAATLKLLLEVKAEAASSAPTDKDASIDTTSWRYLLKPHQWTGYDKPEYIWQPIGEIHKYNIVPLIVGSLKVTVVGLAFAVPLALLAAIYVSQLASPRTKEWLKPGIELLSGIPSVVIGTFALLALATLLQSLFGYQTRLNALVAGIALGISVIPLVFSIAEDALTSVPRSYTQAALALGASKWQAAWQIVLPAAVPGVFSAVALGFGRAIGETMIVLMVTSASVMSWSVFDGARSITATIAAEMAEAVAGGHHYRMLFMLGALLFVVTFITNMVADIVIHRLKARLEGKA
ncbi:MAG: phosphate ABC transporter permease subunit PstC [Verrucomicrobiaceae bacterium]|nr:phosphate ABC transporter permease subunit PstC [Verrucomicrobiaceae bacterium]